MGLWQKGRQTWRALKQRLVTAQAGQRWAGKKINKSLVVLGIVAACLLAGWASGYTYYQNNVETVYRVLVDGKQAGVVKQPHAVESWLDQYIEEARQQYGAIDVQVGEQIEFVPEELYHPYTNLRATLNRLEEAIHVQAEAVKVMLDGKLVGYAPDEETVADVVRQVKLNYVDQEVLFALERGQKAQVTVASARNGNQAGTHETTAVRLKESLVMEEVLVHPEKVLERDELLSRLTQPKQVKQTYTVQEGDVLSTIAQRFDLSVAQLLALNPGLTADSILQIGDELTIQQEEAQLTVVEEQHTIAEEEIPFETKVVEDPNLYKGNSRVVQEGKKGKKRVEYKLIKENGREVSRQVINEEVLTPPVDKVVRRGTKVVPSRGSGQFIWPTRGGYLSSGYGQRWGRFHAGIDIAGAGDRTIVAADHGKVIRAGWHSGGYGNYVVIDHGNGYRTLYAHLASIRVKAGATVQRGDAIGVMGSTGHSTGVHLHFEVHQHGRPVNPLPFVR